MININTAIHLAKLAQDKLTEMKCPAEHIYFIDRATPAAMQSIVFISSKYNNMDLYSRTLLASKIFTGSFKTGFYILGTNHITGSDTPITRYMIYNSKKIFGKKALMLNNVEYASPKDLEYS